MSFSGKLSNNILDWLRSEAVDLHGKTVLCAVSGGRDSMALLHALLSLAPGMGFAVVAAHYNHRLRQSADRDESLVRDYCAKTGISLAVSGGDVRAFAKKQGVSIEDAARTLRYEFLDRTAGEYGADLIATAHHRKDNAETLLLHLLRGSGLNGLGGIPPVRGRIIRPFLNVDRTTIEGYIEENAVPFAEDESNQDTVYFRNRLRWELLPLLEEIAPGCTGRIADTAVRLRADEAHLNRESSALIPPIRNDGSIAIPEDILFGCDRAIAVRVLQGAVRKLGCELTARQTGSVMQLRRSARLSLSGGLRIIRTAHELIFYRVAPPPPPMPLAFGQQRWGDAWVSVYETDEPVQENERTVVLRSGLAPITIAPWDGAGRLAVENGRRTIKRLLADHGIPPAQRELCPAILADGRVIAVFGAGTEHSLRPGCGEKKLVISLRHEI